MENINWKQKLSSRKLWAAVAAFIATTLTAIFREELTPETVTLIGKGVTALCVYIFGEGIVDAVRNIWGHAVTGEIFEVERIVETEQPVEDAEYEK